MPIYEYACPHCHTTFEEWLKNDDDAAEHPCPDCGYAAKRLISHTTFVLKGGGWYVTEYGGHKETPEASPEVAAKASEPVAAADKGKASTPAESGPAAGTPAPASSAPSVPSASSGADAPAAQAKNSQPVAGAA